MIDSLTPARNAVAVCANRGDYTPWIDWWFDQVALPDKTVEDFVVVLPGTYTLDVKLYGEVLRIAEASEKVLADKMRDTAQEHRQKTGSRLPGRYVLKMLFDSTKTDEEKGFLYRIWELNNFTMPVSYTHLTLPTKA